MKRLSHLLLTFIVGEGVGLIVGRGVGFIVGKLVGCDKKENGVVMITIAIEHWRTVRISTHFVCRCRCWLT